MTAYLLTNHIANFVLPAAVMAVLLVGLSRVFAGFFASKRPLVASPWRQLAIVFLVNTAVLAAGLMIFGRDGKMATYLALAVASAVCQWTLLRGWKA